MKMKLNFLLIGFSLITIKGLAQTKTKYDTVFIKTSAVCNTCKNNIEKAMAFEKGVKTSTLDLSNSKLMVVYNPQKTNVDKIKKAISETGYDADDVPANPRAYQKLDPCCKKENQIHEKK